MPTGLPSRVPRAAGGQGQHGEQTLRWAGRAEAATAHAEVALRRKRGPVQRTLGCPPCPGRAPPHPSGPTAPSVPGPLHSPLGTSFPEVCKAGRK